MGILIFILQRENRALGIIGNFPKVKAQIEIQVCLASKHILVITRLSLSCFFFLIVIKWRKAQYGIHPYLLPPPYREVHFHWGNTQ